MMTDAKRRGVPITARDGTAPEVITEVVATPHGCLLLLAALTIPLGIAFYAINIYGAAVLNR